jgi:hypothetical protein
MAEVLSMGENNRSVSFVFAYTTAISRIDSIGYFPHFIKNSK